MPNPTYLPANRVAITDAQTNIVAREWYLFFQNLLALAEANGGGGGGSGTVTSVNVFGGSTGLTTTGGPITTSGTISIGGTLNVLSGGTGATTASGALANLGAYAASNPAGYTSNLGTVTSVAALTLGTTGTDLSSTVATGTTTPVITLNVPTASATNRGVLSAADWTTFNSKGSGTVTSVTGTAPVSSSGGATPAISMAAATTSVDGYLTSTDWNTFNSKLSPFGSQTANFFYAAPNGVAGTPTFRAVVAADIPTLNQNTTGSAGSVANALTAGTGISYSAGTTYDGSAAVTINNSAPMTYPGAGIANSTGTAWGASYTTTGSGTTLALATSPSLVTPLLGTPTSGNFTTGTFTWPTFNQNTTGTAARWTTARLLAGNSVTGAANVPFANKFVVQGTTDTGLSGAQFLGALGTGIVKNTTTTGVLSIAVAADFPTLNQNTTGTASNVTGTVAIANGGTGQTTQTTAFDALAPTTTKGDLIVHNGTDNVRLPIGSDTLFLVADSGSANGLKWAVATGTGVAIGNDTTTTTDLYPAFVNATTGSTSFVYTSPGKYLYKPSTGELTSEYFVADNGIFLNKQTLDQNYTVAAGYSGSSTGPITLISGITITVSTGSRWVVL